MAERPVAKLEEEHLTVNPNEHYRAMSTKLNQTIQEFNNEDPGPGAGKQGEMEATHLDPALRQGYPVPIDPGLIPQKESTNVADKPKNRSSRDSQEPEPAK